MQSTLPEGQLGEHFKGGSPQAKDQLVKILFENGRLTLKFGYAKALVELVKSIPGKF